MKTKKSGPPSQILGAWVAFFAGFGANLGRFWADFGRWSEGLSVSPVSWAVVGCFSCTLSEPRRAVFAVWRYGYILKGKSHSEGQKKSSTEDKRKAHREPESLNVGDGLRA